MEKLSKYYHRLLVALLGVSFLFSCHEKESIIYQRTFTDQEKKQWVEKLLNGAGTDLYYQGSVGERRIIMEAMKYDYDNAWAHRELGVPYLKRGFAAEAYNYYSKACELDPQEWLGYTGYCWLYFYRDYEYALELLERYDAFTPGFVDYPQAISIDYMKGICHLQMANYDQAIELLSGHLTKEKEEVGAAYIENLSYLMLGIVYHKNGQYMEADQIFSEGLQYNQSVADLWYHYALNFSKMQKPEEARMAMLQADKWLKADSRNKRNYVEEFYAVYQEDIDEAFAKWKTETK